MVPNSLTDEKIEDLTIQVEYEQEDLVDLFFEEVKLILQFEDTYSQGSRAFDPATSVDIYFRRLNGDFNEEDSDPGFARVLKVYRAYTTIPAFIDSHKEKETELGQLISQNPYVEVILKYLATGKHIRDYVTDYGITDLENLDEAAYSTSFYRLFIKGEWDNTSLANLAQASLFRKYLNGETNIGSRFGVTLMRLLSSEEIYSRHDPACNFVSHAKAFLRTAFLIDYHKSLNRQNFARLKKFMKNADDPESVDIVAYYRDGFANHHLPFGLKYLLETAINSTHPELKDLISKEFYYSRASVKNNLLFGYRFLENELLLDHPMHGVRPPIEYYMTNRRDQVAKIMQLIAEEWRKGWFSNVIWQYPLDISVKEGYIMKRRNFSRVLLIRELIVYRLALLV